MKKRVYWISWIQQVKKNIHRCKIRYLLLITKLITQNSSKHTLYYSGCGKERDFFWSTVSRVEVRNNIQVIDRYVILFIHVHDVDTFDEIATFKEKIQRAKDEENTPM